METPKLTEKVEQALKNLNDTLFQKNLEKAMRLDEQYSEVKPKPFHYSIEQAIGLPSCEKTNVKS